MNSFACDQLVGTIANDICGQFAVVGLISREFSEICLIQTPIIIHCLPNCFLWTNQPCISRIQCVVIVVIVVNENE